MTREAGLIFCGPVEVYEALGSSAVVVYIMLTALYLIPIWTYSGINVTRLTKSYQNKKSKSLLLLPTVPVFLSFLSGLGIILPCAGIFVETISDAVLTVGLMLYFELAERIHHKTKDNAKDNQEEKEQQMILTDSSVISRLLTPRRRAMVHNFLLSSSLFLLLWSKQVILFMDLINIPHLVPGSTFLSLTPDTVARLVALFLALATCLLSLVKMKNLREDKVDTNPGLYILLLYFLYTAIWIFFIFIEETRLLRDLSVPFVRNYVSHFVKNIQKVFLATIIGVPFVQSCTQLNEKYGSELGQGHSNQAAILTEKNETELEKIAGSVSETTGDEEGERRTSVTTFYSISSWRKGSITKPRITPRTIKKKRSSR